MYKVGDLLIKLTLCLAIAALRKKMAQLPFSHVLFSSLSLCFSEIIDDLAHLVDKTDSRIRNETRRVKLVETKSASCGESFSQYYS